MRKKLVLSATLALLLAVASVSLASATSNDDNDDNDDHTRVINLTATTVQQADIDLGKEGLSLGDRFVFSDDLSEGGKQVGTDGVDCVIVRLDPKDATEANLKAVTQHCVVTLSLPEGQITGQALLTFTNTPTPPPFTVAITGGTGEFRTAHGEVQVTEESDTVAQLAVKLIL
jgi:hypothetical protein